MLEFNVRPLVPVKLERWFRISALHHYYFEVEFSPFWFHIYSRKTADYMLHSFMTFIAHQFDLLMHCDMKSSLANVLCLSHIRPTTFNFHWCPLHLFYNPSIDLLELLIPMCSASYQPSIDYQIATLGWLPILSQDHVNGIFLRLETAMRSHELLHHLQFHYIWNYFLHPSNLYVFVQIWAYLVSILFRSCVRSFQQAWYNHCSPCLTTVVIEEQVNYNSF